MTTDSLTIKVLELERDMLLDKNTQLTAQLSDMEIGTTIAVISAVVMTMLFIAVLCAYSK